jgi:glutathione S-transferase
MSIILHHHSHSRAANVVWMLEELGLEYTIQHVDLRGGGQRTSEYLAVNPMGKVPVVVDGDVVVTEVAAIGVYLADKYAPGRLAPDPTAPERAAFLRWCFYAPSVIEPGCMAHMSKWEYGASSAGWGRFEDIVVTIKEAIGEGPWLLGEQFTMADAIFGGTVRWMTQFGMLPKEPEFLAYIERLDAREANQRAVAINAAELEKYPEG